MRRALGSVLVLALLGGCALNAFRPLVEETGRGAAHPVMAACLRDTTDRYRSFQIPWEATVMTCIGQGFLVLPVEERRCRRPPAVSEVCTAWVSYRRHSITFEAFSDIHNEIAAVPQGESAMRVELTFRQYMPDGAIVEFKQAATFGRP